MAGATISEDLPTCGDENWSKFLNELGISQSQLSGSSSSGITTEFDKICVLIYHRFSDLCYSVPRSFFDVYVIDVNSDSDSDSNSKSYLTPVIGWDAIEISHYAFAMLGSKLFMFGGLSIENGSLQWGNDMSYYDMEHLISSPQKTTPSSPLLLCKESLQCGDKMHGSKVRPYAAVMGDSKICVFGDILFFRGKKTSCANFELFCTLDHKWKKLPDPELKNIEDSITIQSYYVHRSCLIIILTGSLGVYGINVDNHQDHPKWVTLDQSGVEGFPVISGMFAMVDNNVLSNGFIIAKRGEDDQRPEIIDYEVPPNRSDFHLAISPWHAKCFDDRCNSFCLARAAVNKDDRMPYLLVDIVKFDSAALSKLGPDVYDWPKIKFNKSFAFQLPKSSSLRRMEIRVCLPIKNASRKNKSVAAEVDQRKEEEEGKMEKKLKMTDMKNYVESEVP